MKHQFVQGYVQEHLGKPWDPTSGVPGGRSWEPRAIKLKGVITEHNICEKLSTAAARAADRANEVTKLLSAHFIDHALNHAK